MISSLRAEISINHPLRWLDSTSAELAFVVDRDAGNLRFYVTHGNSHFIPSVGNINHARCYREVKLTHLSAMTDQPNDMKEKKLNDKAAIFAQEYNKLMRAYLDQQGIRTCSDKTDWDEMEHQLFLFV